MSRLGTRAKLGHDTLVS